MRKHQRRNSARVIHKDSGRRQRVRGAILKERGANVSSAVLQAIVSLFIGGFVIWFINAIVPHEHFKAGHGGPESKNLKKIWLFVIAIAIHNFPEGLSVGVANATCSSRSK